jgi:hypothetical protein
MVSVKTLFSELKERRRVLTNQTKEEGIIVLRVGCVACSILRLFLTTGVSSGQWELPVHRFMSALEEAEEAEGRDQSVSREIHPPAVLVN